MKLSLHIARAVTIFIIVGMVLNGCASRGKSPTEPDQQTWTISGKTYLAGSKDPLPGVMVKCAGLSATSAPDGQYEINGVPAGRQVLTAEKSGYEVHTDSLEVSADLAHYVYIGVKTANLSGYVTNVVDGPVAGAKVVLGSLYYYTDISGRFEFIRVPRGTNTLSVIHPRYLNFSSPVFLTAEEVSFDASLKRDSVFDISVRADSYVDQSTPTTWLPKYPNYQFLYLRTNGYDEAGVYHGGIEQNVLLYFSFPGFLTDERVTFLDAKLEVCLDRPHVPMTIQTYAIASTWGTLVTYNTQPLLGPLLYTGTISDIYSSTYWTVLGTEGIKSLLAVYRTTGVLNGIMVKGGAIDQVGIYSSHGTLNLPRMTFKVRF